MEADGEGRWRYSDTGELVSELPARACGYCGLANTPKGHDGCLGTLSGVANTCCGHGVAVEAYIQLVGGGRVSGQEAVRLMPERPSKRTEKPEDNQGARKTGVAPESGFASRFEALDQIRCSANVSHLPKK